MAGARIVIRTVTLGGVLLLGAMHTAQAVPESGAREALAAQRIVVRWKPDRAPAMAVGPLAARRLPFHGAAAPWLPMKIVRDQGHTQVYALTTPTTRIAALSVAQTLLNDPRVARADLDHWVLPQADYENDSRSQWHRAEVALGGVSADTTLWARTTGQDVAVAVVDTGVMPTPDLAAMAVGHDLVSVDAGSLDGDGWDADPRPDAHTECGHGWHGTFVASVLGARAGNGQGTAGIAPGVRTVPVRALGSCGGWASDTAFALAWAAGVPVAGAPPNPNPARVINASFGRIGPCESYEQEAIDQALGRAAVVVASAGNGATSAVTAPANCHGVVAVTATTFERKRAQYANMGPEVWLAAPGGGTAFDGTAGSALYSSGVNQRLQPVDAMGAAGTSLSAPIISGVLALMLQVRPYASVEELKTALRTSAQPFVPGSGCESGCGAGIVDAPAAVAAIQTLSPADRGAVPQGAETVAGADTASEVSDSAARNPSGGGAVSVWSLAALALAVMGAGALRRRAAAVAPPGASVATARRSTAR